MATKKNFLRITGTWSELFTPGDYDNYVSDLTGTPALFYISDTKLDPSTITKGWFTLGGNIGQMRLLADKYIYAKACLDDPAGFITIITAHEHLPISDVDDVRDQMNDVIEQVMRLSTRVTKNTIRLDDHAVEYELLLRQIAKQNAKNDDKFQSIDDEIANIYSMQDKHRIEYLNFFDAFAHTNAVIDQHLTTIDYNVVDLWKKLYAAETLVLKYRADYKSLSVAIKNLELNGVSGGNMGSAALIQSELASLTAQLGDITDDISSLNIRLTNVENNGGGSYTDLSADIAKLNNKFAAVNNTITNLSSLDNEDDIEIVFNNLLRNIPNDSVEVTAAIKDIIAKTASNTAVINSGKLVTTDNQYVVDPEALSLSNI